MSDSSHSKELRKRLDALNRQALEKAHSQPADVDDVRRKLCKRRSGSRASAPHGEAEPIVFRRDLPHHESPLPPADEAPDHRSKSV